MAHRIVFLAVAASLTTLVVGQAPAPAPAAPCLVSAIGDATCEIVIQGVLSDFFCQGVATGIGVETSQPGTTYYQNKSASTCIINTLVPCAEVEQAFPLQNCASALSVPTQADLTAGIIDEKAPGLAPSPGGFLTATPLDACYVDSNTTGSFSCVVVSSDIDSRPACTDLGELLAGVLPTPGVKLFFQQSTTSCIAVAPGSCESIVGNAQLNVAPCDSNITAIVEAEPPSIYAAGATALSGAPATSI